MLFLKMILGKEVFWVMKKVVSILLVLILSIQLASTSSAASRADKADDIIDTAMSLIGRADYEFGVRDHRRLILDCSSFTQYVFEKNGIDLKWGTRFQKNAGKYVSKSDLWRGDLVFFSSSSRSSSITHVGIYIGGGEFIHILDRDNGTDVHISSLDSGKWKDRYVTARAIF